MDRAVIPPFTLQVLPDSAASLQEVQRVLRASTGRVTTAWLVRPASAGLDSRHRKTLCLGELYSVYEFHGEHLQISRYDSRPDGRLTERWMIRVITPEEIDNIYHVCQLKPASTQLVQLSGFEPLQCLIIEAGVQLGKGAELWNWM